MKLVLKVDITNENGVISKDHGTTIKAGTEFDFDPVPERVQQLQKLGIFVEAGEEQKQEDPPGDPDGDQDGIDLEDLTKTELESFAKENELEIDFPGKATKPEMIELIEAALTAKTDQE